MSLLVGEGLSDSSGSRLLIKLVLVEYLLCIQALIVSPHISSADVPLKDHDKDVNKDHDGHVVRVLIRVLENLSASRINILVKVDDIDRDHKLPESDPCIKVLTRFLFFNQGE